MSITRNRPSWVAHLAIAVLGSAFDTRSQAACTLTGSGTRAAPFTVSSYADLMQVGTACDLGATYRLTADLDASSSRLAKTGFPPIGKSSSSNSIANTRFTGAFHGGGHVIRKLFINDSTDQNVGLFGDASGASIDSLGLEEAEISGIFKRTTQSGDTGRPSLNPGDTLPKQTQTGGIAGLTDATTTIDVVFVTGSVTGSPAGGIVGTNGGAIRNSYATCRVAGQGYTGGITGSNQGLVNATYVAGPVSGLDSVHGGAIAGVNVGVVGSSYWEVAACGQTGAFAIDFGGSSSIAGYTAEQFKDSANFKGFGFAVDSAWGILQGRAAPVLRAFGVVPDGIRPRMDASAGIELRRSGQVTEIVLPFSATVRIVDASGRQVIASRELSAGAHRLDLPSNRSILFVQVRSGISTTTLSSEPVR